MSQLELLPNTLQAKTTWDELNSKRSELHFQWMDYAGWTIPRIYLDDYSEPASEAGGTQQEQQHDYQSLGSQLVNHLANKIATVLFQPGRPFFRLNLNDVQVKKILQQGVPEEEIDTLLAAAEREGMLELARAKLRTSILEVLKALIVTGNSMLYFPDGKSSVMNAQVYSVKDYVVRRDMSGEIVTIITRDMHTVNTLPEDVARMVRMSNKMTDETTEVTIYTVIKKLPNMKKYVVWQEVDDIGPVPRKTGFYSADDLPFIPLTWNLARGHNYGTGLVEEYAGDFHAFSGLSEAVLNLGALAADIKFLVNPMGQTDPDELNEAETGTYVHGNEEDIGVAGALGVMKEAQALNLLLEPYNRRLSAAFLFNAGVTRDAERVTKEEIIRQANELEGSLGGVYSRLAEEMQYPIAKKIMFNVGKEFKDVEPVIITGIESLSRTTELDQIMLFFADLGALADLPPGVEKRMNYKGIIPKLAAARRVDHKDFLLDEDTVKKNDEREAQLMAQAKAGNQQPPEEQLL